jgi:hypothetical protein
MRAIGTNVKREFRILAYCPRNNWPIEVWILDSLTEPVLGAIFEVSNTLGAGFLEKVYERALLGDSRFAASALTAKTRWLSPINATLSESTLPTFSWRVNWWSS